MDEIDGKTPQQENLRPKRDSADSLEKWSFWAEAAWKSPRISNCREWQQKWVMRVPSQQLMTLKQMLCSAELLGPEEELVSWVCLSYKTILLGFWLNGDLPRLNWVRDGGRKLLNPPAFVSPHSKVMRLLKLGIKGFLLYLSILIFIYANEILYYLPNIDQ